MVGSAVAILDVDGTLHPRSIGLALIEQMQRRDVGDQAHIAALWSTIKQFRRDEIDFPAMVRATTASYGAALRGLHVDELAELARAAWGDLRDQLFPFVRPLIARLHAAGVHPYIVSSSPHEIVGLLAAELGVAAHQGAHFVALDGRYTGATGARWLLGYDEVGMGLEHFAGIRLPESPAPHAWPDAVQRLPVSRAVEAGWVEMLERTGHWRGRRG